MLLAVSIWILPQPVQAKTKIASLPEAIQITPSNDETTPLRQLLPQNPVPSNAKQLVRRDKPIRSNTSGNNQVFNGRTYSKEEVQALIIQYSQEYGTTPDISLRIARCESGFNQFSANRSSSARGVFQWLASSWRNQPASQRGAVSVFDAVANIKAAVWLIAHGQTSPWNASRSCWNK